MKREEIPEGDKLSTFSVDGYEDFAEKLLGLGMKKVKDMKPSDVKVGDVVSAGKLVVELRKLQMSQEAMVTMLAKLFAPKMKVIEGNIEGEIDDKHRKLPEPGGSK